MIKVNLAGTAQKKTAKPAASRAATAANVMPILHVAIAAAFLVGGYLWYSSLSSNIADLNVRIDQADKQRAELEAIIKQDQIYETRKKVLENRITIIEGLKRGQVSPIVSIDVLAEAVDRTEYVWLTNLDQNNALISLTGTGTSVNAIADFVTNLESTGYFKNINLTNAQDNAGNFNFSMTCEFTPRIARVEGGN